MAISTPTAIGNNNTTGTSVTSLAITTTGNISAGDLVLVAIVNHGATSVLPTSVVDSGAANVYTLISIYEGTALATTIAYCSNAAAVASGGTITVSYASARHIAMVAYIVTGAATSAFDVSATNTQTTNTALTTATTAATAQNNELIFAAFGWSGARMLTAVAPYTAGTRVESAGATIRGVCAEWKIVSSTGTQIATATLNNTSVSGSVIATFKEAAAAAGTMTGMKYWGP